MAIFVAKYVLQAQKHSNFTEELLCEQRKEIIMINIGCHLSISKGFEAIAKESLSIGANTFQFFTRNPRGGSVKELNIEDINAFLKLKEKYNIGKIVAHAPYTMNLCSSKESVAKFSSRVMLEDLKRMEYIPGNLYNFHPGSHTGQGANAGIEKITKALNDILWPNMNTEVLLETMAGKGSEVGGKFEEIKEIIDGVELKDNIGVCLDTCHVFDAGYDVVNNLDAVIKEFDETIGLNKLKAIHLNDSKNTLGSKKDRHEKIGQGNIGSDAIKIIINRKEFRDLPFILETPQESLNGYKNEIAMLRGFAGE